MKSNFLQDCLRLWIFLLSEVGLAVYFDLICTRSDQSYFFLHFVILLVLVFTRVRGCFDMWCDCGGPKEVCVIEGINITSLMVVCL